MALSNGEKSSAMRFYKDQPELLVLERNDAIGPIVSDSQQVCTCDVGHIDGGGKNNNFDLTLVTLWHHYVIMAYRTVDKRWPMG